MNGGGKEAKLAGNQSGGDKKAVQEGATKTGEETNGGEAFHAFYVLRHSQRQDDALRHVEATTDEEGKAHYSDLNVLENLPLRTVQEHADDPSITQMGYECAVKKGKVFRQRNVVVEAVISSPNARSVQSAAGFLEGCNGNDGELKVAVDYALAENIRFAPRLLTAAEWADIDIQLNQEYAQHKSDLTFMAEERDIGAVYERHFDFMGHLLNSHPAKNIMLFGHGGSPELLASSLLNGKLPRSLPNLMLDDVGYLDHIKIAEVRPNDFEIVDSTISLHLAIEIYYDQRRA